jgi:hypothetical protein
MPRQKHLRHRAEGEVFLLTSPFIGLADYTGPLRLATDGVMGTVADVAMNRVEGDGV